MLTRLFVLLSSLALVFAQPTPWPRNPERNICQQSFLTEPDPSRPTAPATTTKFGLNPTFEPEIPCGPLNSPGCGPYACSFDSTQSCSRVDKYYVICTAPINYHPNPADEVSMLGIPASYMTDPAYPFPFLPMYDCNCDTHGGAWRPLYNYALGQPETAPAYLYYFQLLASNKDIQGVSVVPEYGVLDMADFSEQDRLVNRLLVRQNARAYMEKLYKGLFNTNLNVNSGHSAGGQDMIVDAIGNKLLNILPSGAGIALNMPMDGDIWELAGQPGLGGFTPYVLPTFQFSSQWQAPVLGTPVLWGQNTDYRHNIWMMPSKSVHATLAPGQLRLYYLLTALNQSSAWNGNITFNGFPPPNIPDANATSLFGPNMATIFKYVEASVGGWVLGIDSYDEMLNYDQLLKDQEKPDGTLSFQFFDKPGGCAYFTEAIDNQFLNATFSYWAYSSSTPQKWATYSLAAYSTWSTAEDPNMLICMNGLTTTGIFQCTDKQWARMSWRRPVNVGPCNP